MPKHAGGYDLTCPVFFVGFMGAGKTSVSQYLATTLGLPSIDADEYLELIEDRAITDIFADDGEDAFRTLETTYLRELAARSPRFIACGGGVVKRPENVELMRQAGRVVYLQVSADEAAARIPNTESRPLFKDPETARVTIAERIPLYQAAAHYTVDTVGRSIADVAAEVRAILLEDGILLH